MSNPAIDQDGKDQDGNNWWCNDVGQYHRLDGPAIIFKSGTQVWYKHGKRHRLDGPAVEYSNGNKFWYFEGDRHRLDGPAVEYANGTKSWYLNSQEYTQEEFELLKFLNDKTMIG
jgi:hypothetical protein